MLRKFLFLPVFLAAAFCFNTIFAYAQESIDKLKTELNTVQGEMKQATDTYKNELAKIDKETADKIEALKREFHKTRDGYLEEKKNKSTLLLKNHTEKIKPLQKREKELRNKIEPLEPNDFAKHR